MFPEMTSCMHIWTPSALAHVREKGDVKEEGEERESREKLTWRHEARMIHLRPCHRLLAASPSLRLACTQNPRAATSVASSAELNVFTNSQTPIKPKLQSSQTALQASAQSPRPAAFLSATAPLRPSRRSMQDVIQEKR